MNNIGSPEYRSVHACPVVGTLNEFQHGFGLVPRHRTVIICKAVRPADYGVIAITFTLVDGRSSQHAFGNGIAPKADDRRFRRFGRFGRVFENIGRRDQDSAGNDHSQNYQNSYRNSETHNSLRRQLGIL